MHRETSDTRLVGL